MRWANWRLWARLVAVMTLFVIAMMLAVSTVLFGTGVFSAGTGRVRAYLDAQVTSISNRVEAGFGKLSVGGTQLSRDLNLSIDQAIKRLGITFQDLEGDSNAINEVLQECLNPLRNMLSRYQVSGAYLVLDTTVNPDLGGEHSRAGLYLRNTEPNVVNRAEPTVGFFRGPIELARKHEITAAAQWDMEFSLTEGDFFHKALEGVKPDTDISRLYWWNPRAKLIGDSDYTMLLSVPILASDGLILGVCGLEVSEMLFKMLYLPTSNDISGAFVMLSPMLDTDGLDFTLSLVASPRYKYPDESLLVHCRVPRHVVGRLRQEREITVQGLPEQDHTEDW